MPINTITSSGVFNFEPVYTGEFDPVLLPLGDTSTSGGGYGGFIRYGWRRKTKADRRREKGTKK